MITLNNIKENWVVLVFMGSLIIGWTSNSLQLQQVKAQSLENKTSLEAVKNIEIDIAVIKQQITNINDKLK